jgi:hypothetical protein
VVNFRMGREFFSINVANCRAHQLEIAVDHDDGRASGGA